jgi:hypothetical protein
MNTKYTFVLMLAPSAKAMITARNQQIAVVIVKLVVSY